MEKEKITIKDIIIGIELLTIIALIILSYFKVLDKKTNTKKVSASSETVEKSKKETCPKCEQKDVNIKFDETKSLNTNNMDYKMQAWEMAGISAEIVNDKNAEIHINKSIVENNFGISTNNIQDNYNIVLEKEVADIHIGGIGQDALGTYIIFLLEDGTVNYIEAYKALQSNNFTPQVANGITEVINFKDVNANIKGNGTGWYASILAMKKDGTFYDLSNIIQSN